MATNPVTRLRAAGVSYDVQAALVGTHHSTIRRWEAENGISPYHKILLSAIADVCDDDTELAESVEASLMTRGLIPTLHELLSAYVSNLDR